MSGISRSPRGLCLLKGDRDDTREVVPGALFMKHMFSRDFSIAYYEVPAGAGSKAPVRAHSPGEEAAVVLSGSGTFETPGRRAVRHRSWRCAGDSGRRCALRKFQR